jgi:photosystem II stability/assembly factor-like uncharacterized protein
MKNLILLLIILTFSIQPASSQSWFLQPVNIGSHLWSVKFTSPTVGYSVGSIGLIYKTTNGGNQWIPLTTNHQGFLYDICFPNQNTGYAIGERGDLVKTTNAGQSWSIVDVSFNTFNGIAFADANTGVICGHQQIFKTTNGGNNWYEVSNNLVGALRSINYVTGNPAILYCCGSNGIIAKSIDHGESWVQQPTGSSFEFHYVNPYAAGSAIVVGISKILRTTNGGENWISIPHSPPTYFTCVQMVNSTTGFAAGQSGHIFKTYNGGANWFRLGYYEDVDFNFLHFPNETTGYFARSDGYVIKTSNGGGSPIGLEPNSSEIPREFSLEQNYPNPFNPATKIDFSVPKAGFVSLKIYDVSGREVENAVNENLGAGTYTYDFDASGLASGVYFYRMHADGFTDVKKMTLIK